MKDPQDKFEAYALVACPGRHRSDFIQEMWVGALTHGLNVDGAMASAKRQAETWLKREKRHEKRQATNRDNVSG